MGAFRLHHKLRTQRRIHTWSGTLLDSYHQVSLPSEPVSMETYHSWTYSAASIPGRLLPSHLGDRIGHFNVITACSLLIGVFMLTLWLPFNYHHSSAATIVFAVLFGFVSGAFISLMMPCVFKLGSLQTLGQRFGTFQILVSIRSVLSGLEGFELSFVLSFETDVAQLGYRTANNGPDSRGSKGYRFLRGAALCLSVRLGRHWTHCWINLPFI